MKKLLATILILFTLFPMSAFAAATFMESGTDATQDFSMWDSTAVSSTGVLTSDTSRPHTGPRSIKMFSGSTALSNIQVAKNGVLNDSGRRISGWFNTDTPLAGNSTSRLIESTNGSAAICWQIMLTTTGKLQIVMAGSANETGTTVLSANTWYRISVAYYFTNATTYNLKVYLNGNLEITAQTGATITNVGGVNLIIRYQPDQVNASAWWDDIYVDDGASSSSQNDTGDIRVTAKRPFANGTTNGFTTQIGSGGSGYGSGHAPQVNEQPLNVANGWSMVGAGSAVTEEYNVEGLTVGDVNLTGAPIVDYMGWVYASSLANETGSIIVSGSNSNISLTSTKTMFMKAAGSTTYPAGSGSDVGVITTNALTTVSLYEAGILVAFNPAPFVARILNPIMWFY